MNKELSFPFIEGAIQKGCIYIELSIIYFYTWLCNYKYLVYLFHRFLHGWTGNCGFSIWLYIIYF